MQNENVELLHPTLLNENSQELAAAPVVLQTGRYPRRGFQFAKRILDIVLSGLALVLFFPVFVVISLTVIAQDGSPIIFRQRRIGVHGKVFYIYKFRTMVKNAEEILRNRPELMEEYKRTFKIENDPRILRAGKFLRASSLDELPQLLNVFAGNMSLVGPRPIVEAEIAQYGDDKDYYLAMKPGCAGLWQCSGRSLTTYEERVALDKQYYLNAGLRYDLLILIKTIVTVLQRKGAH